VKPENVFISMLDPETPQVKLLDFGCACFLDHGGGRDGWFVPGLPMGGSFCPPEDRAKPPSGLSYKDQVRWYGQLDDIYRAGGVLYAMLMQDLPDRGFTAPRFKELSADCQSLLKKLLGERKERPKNCAEVLNDKWLKAAFDTDPH
jgi:serine/threonine protein kinase